MIGRLLKTAERFIANHADAQTLAELSSWDVEPIGRRGWVGSGKDGRNLFTFVARSGQQLFKL